jgi:hypothetical protein
MLRHFRHLLRAWHRLLTIVNNISTFQQPRYYHNPHFPDENANVHLLSKGHITTKGRAGPKPIWFKSSCCLLCLGGDLEIYSTEERPKVQKVKWLSQGSLVSDRFQFVTQIAWARVLFAHGKWSWTLVASSSFIIHVQNPRAVFDSSWPFPLKSRGPANTVGLFTTCDGLGSTMVVTQALQSNFSWV